jgi:GTP-binding protein Era
MMQEVRSALEEVDVVLHLVDASVPWGRGEAFLFEMLDGIEPAVLGLLTKIDLVRPRSELLPLMERYARHRPETTVLPVSALEGEGLDELREALFAALPEGPRLYPTGVTTTQTERFWVAEIVREKLLHATRNELPYTTGVVVETFEEEPGLLRIEAVIHVERSSQKAIVIGKRGRMIREIGTAARTELEARLGTRVWLGLRVKVSPRWRDDVRILADMEPGVAVLEEDLQGLLPGSGGEGEP